MKVRRISSQGDDSFEKTYREMGQELGGSWINVGEKMIDLINHLERGPCHPDIWAFTSLSTLVLANEDDYRSGIVRISVDSNVYHMEYPAQPEVPPFLGKVASYNVTDVEEASSLALEVFDRLVSSNSHSLSGE